MKQKIITIGATIILLMGLGLIYGYSIFVNPLEQEFGWNRSETSLTFTISMIAMSTGVMASGYFNNKSEGKRSVITMSISACLIAVGFIITSFTNRLISFYIFYGVFVGFAVGFAYSKAISFGTKLFPEKKGLMSGMLMMAFSIGTLVLGTVCRTMLVSVGWRQTFVILGVVYGIALMCLGVLIAKTENLVEEEEQLGNTAKETGLSSLEMVKTSSFKIIFVWLVLLSSAGLAFMGHVATCATEMGAPDALAVLLVGIASFSSGAGRLLFGIIYDRIGIKITMRIIGGSFVVASVTAVFSIGAGQIILFAIACVLIGLCYGASPISTSVLLTTFFGMKNFSSNFGIGSMNVIPAAFLGPYLVGYLYSASGTYTKAFYGLIVFAILAIACLVVIQKNMWSANNSELSIKTITIKQEEAKNENV